MIFIIRIILIYVIFAVFYGMFFPNSYEYLYKWHNVYRKDIYGFKKQADNSVYLIKEYKSTEVNAKYNDRQDTENGFGQLVDIIKPGLLQCVILIVSVILFILNIKAYFFDKWFQSIEINLSLYAKKAESNGNFFNNVLINSEFVMHHIVPVFLMLLNAFFALLFLYKLSVKVELYSKGLIYRSPFKIKAFSYFNVKSITLSRSYNTFNPNFFILKFYMSAIEFTESPKLKLNGIFLGQINKKIPPLAGDILNYKFEYNLEARRDFLRTLKW